MNLLEQKKQTQLLRFFDELNDTQKLTLLGEIDGIDWGFESAFRHDGKKEDSLIEEIDALHLEKILPDQEHYRSIGLQAIRDGKLCLLLLAGGQGTRLGFDKPKGCFNVGLTKDLYIFQLLIEHIMDVVRAADAYIPLYIMTSNINYQDTITFFEAHDYFGYDASYVHFFIQEMNPATDFDGKILLKSKYEEMHIGRIVSEVIVRFEEGDGILIVDVACHDIKWNISIGSTHHIHDMFNQ